MLRFCTYLSALAAAALLLVPALGHAGVELGATELRSFELPEGFNLGAAQIQATRTGQTVLSATTGDDVLACTVILVDDQGATQMSYKYQGGTTACVGVLPHPDGGFFVRGGRADAEQGDVWGFTARIDADGNELWAVDDELLLDNGKGSYYANYAAAHPKMAYSAEFGYLLGFTVGTVSLDGDQQIAEGHVLRGGSGEVVVRGWTFQGTGSPGFVAQATARASDGYFLLYIYSAGSQGAEFFAFNGRNSNSKYEPLGEDWSQRYVRQLEYGPDQHVHLLWTPGDAADSPTAITVVEAEADENFDAAEVWSGTYEPTVEADFAEGTVDLGLPGGMWVGSDYTLILYNAGGELVLRAIDVATGEELGVAPLAGLTEHAPQAILNGEEGRLKLLALDAEASRLFEYRLEITPTEDDTPGGDAGVGDAGFGDVGLGDTGDAGDASSGGGRSSSCAAGAPTAPAPWGAALLAIGLVLFTIDRRSTRAG